MTRLGWCGIPPRRDQEKLNRRSSVSSATNNGVKRYFFHLQTFGVRSVDEDGLLLSDKGQVVDEAMKAARTTMASGMRGLDNGSWRGWAIIVTDEVGQTVLKVPFELLERTAADRISA